jgi:hypothetical protein
VQQTLLARPQTVAAEGILLDQAFAQLVGATDADTSGGSQDDVPYSFHERQPDSDAFSDATQPINTPSAVSRHAMGSPLVLSMRRIFVYAMLIGLIIFPNSLH